jgi:hypothetical protein
MCGALVLVLGCCCGATGHGSGKDSGGGGKGIGEPGQEKEEAGKKEKRARLGRLTGRNSAAIGLRPGRLSFLLEKDSQDIFKEF